MTNTPPTATPPAKQRGAKTLLMPGLVLGFLGAHMLFIIIAITLAVGDRSFAVVPDYYRKGQDWDAHRAELAASAALGWSARVLPSTQVSMRGERELAVVLLDAEGRAIEGAHVSVTMYHHARAKEFIELELDPTEVPGRYAVTAKLRSPGQWALTLRVHHSGVSYLHEETTYIRGSYEGAGR